MTLEAGKEMDRRCVLGWLSEIYCHPTVAFNTYSDEQQIEFAHDALVLLKEQEVVVRCKDCKHGEKPQTFKYYPNLTWCNKIECTHDDDWFCADGELKD